MPQQRLISYEEIYKDLNDRYPADDVHNFFNQHENAVLRRHGLAEATPVMGRENGSPALGTELPRSEWGKTGVIGIVEKSPNGNAVLHVGNLLEGGDPGWQKVAHVTMTPKEREQLIAELIALR